MQANTVINALSKPTSAFGKSQSMKRRVERLCKTVTNLKNNPTQSGYSFIMRTIKDECGNTKEHWCLDIMPTGQLSSRRGEPAFAMRAKVISRHEGLLYGSQHDDLKLSQHDQDDELRFISLSPQPVMNAAAKTVLVQHLSPRGILYEAGNYTMITSSERTLRRIARQIGLSSDERARLQDAFTVAQGQKPGKHDQILRTQFSGRGAVELLAVQFSTVAPAMVPKGRHALNRVSVSFYNVSALTKQAALAGAALVKAKEQEAVLAPTA